jgi:hypothetical protein
MMILTFRVQALVDLVPLLTVLPGGWLQRPGRKIAWYVVSRVFMEDLLRARDPTTPEEELRRLLQASAATPRETSAPEIREALAGNPNAPVDLLQTLLAEHPDAVLGNPALPLILLERPDFWASLSFPTMRSVLQKARLDEGHLRMFFPEAKGLQDHEEALLQLPATPEDFLDRLPLHTDTSWLAMARHPNAPVRKLAVCLDSHLLSTRQAALANPRAPADRIAALRRAGATEGLEAPEQDPAPLPLEELERMTNWGPFAQLLVARNPATTPELLRRIGTGYDEIQLALIRHPKITPEHLDTLVSEWSMREKFPKPGPLDGTLALKVEPQQLPRLAIARHPRTPRKALERLAHDNVAAVRAAVATHPQLSPRCVNNLGLDDHPAVVLEALKNPSLGTEVIDVLVRYRPPALHAALAARHPNASPGALRELSRGPHEEARDAARKRLAGGPAR